MDLAELGGKGLNLVRLRDAGFDVPPFVVVPTAEYLEFVAAARLAPIIDAALSGVTEGTVEAASNTIRAAFAATDPTPEQRDRITALVSEVTDMPVAVRSSATAEDLPEASFAGQQDTFLHVAADDVLARIVDCWSSLWTARAISYRLRHGVHHRGLAVAVVVQHMVNAEASGVMFTVNPLTGRRDDTVIESVRGLGDPLVSGRAMPDRFLVRQGRIATRETTGVPSLSNRQILALAALGGRIDAALGVGQDIEWVRVADHIQVVQARPVTGLFPIPESPPGQTAVWFSFGAVQGVLGPITPLGSDVLIQALSRAAQLAGVDTDRHRNAYVRRAAARIWMRIDGVLRMAPTRALAKRVMPAVEPGSVAILEAVLGDPTLDLAVTTPSPQVFARTTRVLRRLLPAVPRSMKEPRGARAELDRVITQLLDSVAERLSRANGVQDPRARLAARVDEVLRVADVVFPTLLPAFAPIMGPSLAMTARLRRLAAATGLPDADALALTVLRSLPGNVTAEMTLALADAAGAMRADAPSYGWVVTTPPAKLAEQYRRGGLPPRAQAAMASFLERYGMRGVAEIDLGTPRWRDDTTGMWDAVASYLAIDDPAQWPQAIHERGAAQADAAIEQLAAASGPRAGEVRRLGATIRGLFGARETPKFAIVRCFGLLREALNESASDLVAAGALRRADDLYFLTLDELPRAFVGGWDAVIAERRAEHEREARRERVPRMLLSDGRVFYDAPGGTGDFGGTGVSPGVAEGVVRVVDDPARAGLSRGEILVCRGTDPAWTPLFSIAAGLITEVGGLMTHGAVVAREYGLPAVVGVADATTRLQDGDRIRLDGSTGAITKLPG